MINILSYLILTVKLIKKDWVDYALSGTTLSSFYAFQEEIINEEYFWIPVVVGVLTILKISLDIYTSIKNIKSKNKSNNDETQDNQQH